MRSQAQKNGHIAHRQQATLRATLDAFESPERAPVAAAQIFVRADGAIETSINNVEPEHVGPILSALRRVRDILEGGSQRATHPAPRERGFADTFLVVTTLQLLAFSTAAYINTIPWVDVLLTVGCEFTAIATGRLFGQRP